MRPSLLVTVPHGNCCNQEENSCLTKNYQKRHGCDFIAEETASEFRDFFLSDPNLEDFDLGFVRPTVHRYECDLNRPASRDTLFHLQIETFLTTHSLQEKLIQVEGEEGDQKLCRDRNTPSRFLQSLFLLDFHSFPGGEPPYSPFEVAILFIPSIDTRSRFGAFLLLKMLLEREIQASVFEGGESNEIIQTGTKYSAMSLLLELNEATTPDRRKIIFEILCNWLDFVSSHWIHFVGYPTDLSVRNIENEEGKLSMEVEKPKFYPFSSLNWTFINVISPLTGQVSFEAKQERSLIHFYSEKKHLLDLVIETPDLRFSGPLVEEEQEVKIGSPIFRVLLNQHLKLIFKWNENVFLVPSSVSPSIIGLVMVL